MIILIDNVVFSLQKSGGISMYWKELILTLLKDENSFLKVFFLEEKFESINVFRNQLALEPHQIILNKGTISFWSRYKDINLDYKGLNFVYHSSYYRTLSRKFKKNNLVKEVVTVHDFTYEHFNKGLKKWVHCIQKKKGY